MNNAGRIYKYDNVKALLILLVVIGHMTTDYVSDSHAIRNMTLWIYSFHMPAFIFISGLVHKRYITKENSDKNASGGGSLRWDKVLGFFFLAYGLKIFLQITRTLMGQNPTWHWIEEPGIPWYLFVLAEYEIIFYALKFIDEKVKPVVIIVVFFTISAVIGYFPIIGDAFCLSRMINFLPIYAIGYYTDMQKALSFFENKKVKTVSAVFIVASVIVCSNAPWRWYRYRKWFTGRRSYEFLQEYFSNAIQDGWWIRIAIWAIAIIMTIAVISVVPNKKIDKITNAGGKTLQVYFWHRPLCYLFRSPLMLLPNIFMLLGGDYDISVAGEISGLAFENSALTMTISLMIYILIAVAVTYIFSLKIFEHPTKEIFSMGEKAVSLFRLKREKNA